MVRFLLLAAATHFLLLFFHNAAGQRLIKNSRLAPLSIYDANVLDRSAVRILVRDSTDLRKWIRAHLPHVSMKPGGANQVFVLSGLKTNDVNIILQHSGVRYAEPINRRPVAEGGVPGLDLSVNGVTALSDMYPTVKGRDLRVSVKENPFNRDDIDLKGRVFEYELIPAQFDQHATIMATIIAGAGNTSPANMGVASEADIGYADFSRLMPEPTDVLIAQMISVQNHSYGVGVENYYGIESFSYDEQCIAHPTLVHVFSSGNTGNAVANSGIYEGIQGFANITGQFKNSKNGIVVGGASRTSVIEVLSSRGPTGDGRVKPEVVAYCAGGTSEAAAIVSGMCLLAQDAFRQQHGSMPPSALVRAAIVNSADDAGRPNVDYEYGYGTADAPGLIRTMVEGRFFFGSVGEEESEFFTIDVPEGTHRLKVTLAWTDPGGDPAGTTMLVNDLDLSVEELSTSTVYKPWTLSTFPLVDSLTKVATRKADHVNNLEQVTIDRPAAGQYHVRVEGHKGSGEPQAFSIAYEMEQGLTWFFPNVSHPLDAGHEVSLRWSWTGNDATADIEWRLAGADSWTQHARVMLSEGYAPWIPPLVNAVVEMRLMVSGSALWSGSFVVSETPDIRLAYHCENELVFSWPAAQVSEYIVYKLGDVSMDQISVVSDTFFTVNTLQETARYFSVAPRIQDHPGLRSESATYGIGGDYCYLVSFLAREMVTDSVYLDIVLGTTIGLRSILVERESGAGFQVVGEYYSPPVSVAFYDADPMPGRNRYRVQLERDRGPAVVSDIEEVWYTRRDDIEWFPNPVSYGQAVNLIVADDPVRVRIYDAVGNLIRNRSEDGEIKTIETHGLKPGFYFMQIETRAGKDLKARLIIK